MCRCEDEQRCRCVKMKMRRDEHRCRCVKMMKMSRDAMCEDDEDEQRCTCADVKMSRDIGENVDVQR